MRAFDRASKVLGLCYSVIVTVIEPVDQRGLISSLIIGAGDYGGLVGLVRIVLASYL